MSDHLEHNDASRIGCHAWGTSAPSTAGIPTFAAAGCRWLRSTRPMQFEVVCHAGRGTYDWAAAGEASVDLALANGFSVMGILDGRWGNETLTNFVPWASPIWEHLDCWAEFVAATVEHYRGRVRCWEIINEPPFFWWYPNLSGAPWPEKNPPMRRAPIRHYAALLKVSAQVIRRLDPQARIVAGSGFSDGLFLQRLYELGCRDDFDVASVHYLNCKHPDDFARGYRRVRAVMAAHGDANKPLWDTENGPAGAVIGQAVTSPEEYEGLYNIYRHCLAHEHGLERYFWFNPVGTSAGDQTRPNCRTAAGALAPAYQALHTLTAAVGDAPLRGWCHLADEVHAYVFDAASGPVSLLWSTASATARLQGGYDGTDHTGAPLHVGGELALSGRPLLLRGDLLADGLDAQVTGRREVVVAPWANKSPTAATPTKRAPRAPAGMALRDPRWAALPFLATHAERPVPTTMDHFCAVTTSVPGDVQLAWDEEALHLHVLTYDEQRDPACPTGLVQVVLRDQDPAVGEWPFFYNGYGLFNLFASQRGPLCLRYEHLWPDEYPAGIMPGATLAVAAHPRGVEYWARFPWAALGPLRPGRHSPWLLHLNFNRADGLLAVPAADDPWEWSHNFGDNFIVKPPALTCWLSLAAE